MSQHKAISDPDLYSGKLAKTIIEKFKSNQLHWSKVFALYQIQAHV
jgi:asparagine synthase (glutamine-hydrolysing)